MHVVDSPERRTSPKPIVEVAADLGLAPDDLELYGPLKAKVRLEALARPTDRPPGRYIVVTAITPRRFGEGKTTTAIGLAQALWRLGRRAVVTIRQPSLGPVFGIKGGGAGGGRAQIMPSDDLNLHLTGDSHAVTAAHNLCAAFLDNHLHQGNALDLDPEGVVWRRVLDVNDRALREVVTGLGANNGPSRQTGFDITAASEVMAILAFAADLSDLRARLGRIVVGFTRAGRPVTADDLRVAGAMAVLLRDAIKPNLLQTVEQTPALVHAGPFGNVAPGASSIIADRLGLRLADLVVTEAGFGSDLGAEKFFNLKCRTSGLRPDAAVLVVTVRGLKAHSARVRVTPGRPLPPALLTEDLDALEDGLPNLTKHIENVALHGVRVVVAINRFPTDSPRELDRVAACARAAGADDAVVSTVFTDGGAGGLELAQAVISAVARGSTFRYLYDLAAPIEEKIERIATAIYGADAVAYEPAARDALCRYASGEFAHLPICMAKTPYSLSGDPALKGRPQGFTLTVRDVRIAAGAGYLTPLVGDIMTMPGLGAQPAGAGIDLAPDGSIIGLT